MAQDGSSSGRGFFRDRAVLITGASSGIGQDLALAFARRGAQVALLARRKAKLQELATRIAAAGGSAVALQCDVTRRGEVRDAVDRAINEFGQVDVVINSAGILVPGPVETMSPEDLERMVDVNLFGTLHTIQAVLPSMREAGSGNIVNIASLAGRRGVSPLGGYSATKFAIVGLTEALRVELFGSGITVSLVMPGVIDTPMADQARGSDELKGLKGFPRMFSMPTSWVTWAVMAAVALKLTEVDVPPGAGVAEKLASLFPGITDAFLSVGARLLERANRWRARSQGGEDTADEDQPHLAEVARGGQR